MPRYKHQFYLSVGGELGHTYEFEAADDAAAIAFAALWSDYAPMELWYDNEMLRRWDAPHAGAVRAEAARSAQSNGDDPISPTRP